MDLKPRGARAASLALVLLIALGLKAHYSAAPVDRLAWVMRPTAALVERCTGLPFEPVPGTGYVNVERRVVIAKGCAGVNFLIVAFSLIAWTLIAHATAGWRTPLLVFPALASAYASTVLVNTVRIVIAVEHAGWQGRFGWLTPERLHRGEGIAVYFAALAGIAALSEAVAASCGSARRAEVRPGCGAATRPPLRKLFFVTLGAYLAMTLGVPLLNGALRGESGRFAEHALWVVGVPLCLGGFFLLAAHGWRSMRRSLFVRTHERPARHPLGDFT